MLLLTALVVKKSYFLAENYFTFPEKRRSPKLNGTNSKSGHSWKNGKTPKKYNQSDLIHDSNHIMTLSIMTLENLKAFVLNQSILFQPSDSDKFRKVDLQKENTKEKKRNVHNTASELYNDLLQTYFGEYCDLLDAKRSKMNAKYDPTNLRIDEYDYSEWYKELVARRR